MKKTLVALTVLVGGLFTANQSNAQMVPGSNLSIGVSPMLPVGDLSKTHNFGIGGDLQYGYNFDESVGLTLSAGYNHFLGKNLTGNNNVVIKASDFGVVPIKAGVKYGIGSFYVHPQLGVAVGTEKDAGSAFTYGAGIGTNVAGFDLSARYEGWKPKGSDNTAGFVGLRLGYTLPMGR